MQGFAGSHIHVLSEYEHQYVGFFHVDVDRAQVEYTAAVQCRGSGAVKFKAVVPVHSGARPEELVASHLDWLIDSMEFPRP